MTRHNSDTGSGSDSDSDSDSDSNEEAKSILGQLREIVEALSDIEEKEGGHRSKSGTIDRGRTRISYEYDVTTGLDKWIRSHGTPSQRKPNNTVEPENPVQVEVREINREDRNGVFVVADVSGVVGDEIEVNLNSDEQILEISVDDTLIRRVDVNRPDMTVEEVNLTNQVLEARLYPGNQIEYSEKDEKKDKEEE